MKIYVVMDNENIYGTFSTLENAKNHVKKIIHEDIVVYDREKMFIEYVVYSFVLDKSDLKWSDDMKRLELKISDGEIYYDASKGD